MTAKNLLACVATVLFVLVIPNANAEFDVQMYCTLVPFGTRMPSFDNCQTFYTCQGDNVQPTVSSCADGQSFDVNSQTCRAASSVNCFYGVSNPCANKNNAYAPMVNNCQGWIYCSNGAEKGRGNCPNGQIFDATTGSCIFGTCNNVNTPNGYDPVYNVCEIMQAGTFFGGFDDCAQWNMCSASNTLQSGDCGTNLVYNVQRRMCLTNDGTMCARTNGEAPSAPQAPCNAAATGSLVGDTNVCNIFYQCDGTNWVKQQCTTGNYFDVTTSRCLTRRNATPQENCNRCQFATTTWVNSVDPTCQTYDTCRSGSKVGNGECPADQFFNEQRQACVPNAGLPGYASTNGACAADPATTEEPIPQPPAPTTEDPTTGDGVTTEEPTTEEPTTEEPTTLEPTPDPQG